MLLDEYASISFRYFCKGEIFSDFMLPFYMESTLNRKNLFLRVRNSGSVVDNALDYQSIDHRFDPSYRVVFPDALIALALTTKISNG